jgi:predicted transport protein
MPVFRSAQGKAVQLTPVAFKHEKELQQFMEQNLEVLLGIRLVASEFSTGEKHGGRIDTLGLDEAGSPVILEYKWDKSESVINQGLFYLDWLVDHKGDFVVAAQKAIGPKIEVDWHSPRLIVVASTYTKYDPYAVNQLNINIELLHYQHYTDGVFVLEAINEPLSAKPAKKPTAVGKQKTPETGYTLESHLARTTTQAVKDAFMQLRDLILPLDGVVEKVNQKSQITYRATKSFAACAFNKTFVQVQFKGGPHIDDPEHRAKDIRSYQWGYQWMCDLKDTTDVQAVFAFVRGAYELEK